MGYVLVEVAAGFSYNSMALLSDAGHNFGDVLALMLAWGASVLSRTEPTERRTYGMKRATVLASLLSALLLCLALGGMIWESLVRLSEPVETSGFGMAIFAALGVAINSMTAALFLRDRHSDLNIRSAFLHMAADATVSLGVVIAGIVIHHTGWWLVDPVVALIVAILILISGLGLLRESLDLSMDAVPDHVDITEVRRFLESLSGVVDVHHLHIWGMSTTETALTVHLVLDKRDETSSLLKQISNTLKLRFSIQHPTIQVEGSDVENGCVFAPPYTALDHG